MQNRRKHNWEQTNGPLRTVSPSSRPGICGMCGGKLNKDDIARGRRFCSYSCKRDFDKVYRCGNRFKNRIGRRNRNPAWLREHVLSRDNFRCTRCGAQPKKWYFAKNCGVIEVVDNSKLTIHHITPLSEGGTDDEANLTTLCVDCHKAEHERRFKQC